VKKFFLSTNVTSELFVVSEPIQDENNIDEVIRVYNDSYNAILEVNNNDGGSSPIIIVGLYLGYPSETFAVQLEAIQRVFGHKSSSRLPIGAYRLDCASIFRGHDINVLQYLHRLNFITCGIEVDPFLNPELAGNITVQNCIELQRIASSQNIDAEIMCIATYSSEGTLKSVDNHQPFTFIRSVYSFVRFWCSVTEAIAQQNNVIMLGQE